jgi:hypothetical protein
MGFVAHTVHRSGDVLLKARPDLPQHIRLGAAVFAGIGLRRGRMPVACCGPGPESKFRLRSLILLRLSRNCWGLGTLRGTLKINIDLSCWHHSLGHFLAAQGSGRLSKVRMSGSRSRLRGGYTEMKNLFVARSGSRAAGASGIHWILVHAVHGFLCFHTPVPLSCSAAKLLWFSAGRTGASVARVFGRANGLLATHPNDVDGRPPVLFCTEYCRIVSQTERPCSYGGVEEEQIMCADCSSTCGHASSRTATWPIA